jgi:hypothetical protein
LGELLIVGFCYLAFICEEIKENLKKQHFFILLQLGFEPTTFKKWQKRLFRDTPSLVPRSGASPGLRRLSRGRGKYIFKVQLIFIAKNFSFRNPSVVLVGRIIPR